MKTSLLFVCLVFAAESLLQAQQLQNSSAGAVKSSYIKNQGYLSSGSALSLYNAHGDSLKGFDETGQTRHLLAIGLEGAELNGHINHLKREYINNKYNLIPVVQPDAQVPANIGGGKKKGSTAVVNLAPCVNEGFESTPPGPYNTANAVTGWTIDSRSANSSCTFNNWVAGSTEFSIVATPLTNWPFAGSPITIIPHSPLGGTVVAQLNDANSDYNMTRIRQTFPVSSTNALFQFAYAGYWQDGGGGHGCCDQPGVDVKMFDCTGAPLTCSSMSLFPGNGCQSIGVQYSTTTQGHSWTNWQVKSIDLTPYIGTCITVEFITTDCSFGGHYGTALLDVACGLQNIGTPIPPSPNYTTFIPGPVSFCAGTNTAQISAPSGYASYQWISPVTGTVPAPQGTMSTLFVSPPIPGATYTCHMVSATGCMYTTTISLAYSQVNIAGVAVKPSCTGGASGSATVAGNGSGTGYTYSWMNSANNVVGTQSVVTGLSPGIYSVTIGGLGAASCGTALTTVTITSEQAAPTLSLTPFCGSQAYLQTPGGSNFQWYNTNNQPIGGATGSQPFYIVNAPSAGNSYWVSYTSLQNCKDSVKYTLVASPYGNLSAPTNSVKLICPAASNGTAAIKLTPAAGAPSGFNTYSVISVGNTPAYSGSAGPTSIETYTLGGLSAGTYSVNAFDGSCHYSTTFNVNELVFDYTVTPLTRTLCPGGSVNANITFTNLPSLNQYSYSWSPSTWLAGNNGQSALVAPANIPNGSVITTVYTVVVTPAAAPCPKTKTISVTAVNPPTPTISPVNPFCNTSAPVQIQATPGGGTFINSASSPGLIGPGSGVITPTLAPFGVNTFTYAASVYTCVATQTASFEVSQFFSAALTSPTAAPRCVTAPQLNLMNLVQQTNGSWSGEGVTGNFFNAAAGSTLQPGATKSYVLTYNTVSSPDPAVCPANSTLLVDVTNTLVPAIVPVDPFCNNAAPVSMTVNPAGGVWAGSGISTAGIINPANIIQTGPHTVTYSVNIGPCINTASSTFNVSRFNSAALSGTVGERCFNSNQINLMTMVQNTVNGTWSGPNVTANSFNPAGLFTGVYNLTYKTTSSPDAELCPDEATLQVPVLNPQVPNISEVGPLCSLGEAVQLSVSGGNGKWTGTPYLTADGLFSPALAAVGNNAVQYVVGTPTCFAQQTKFISVEAFVSAKLTDSQLPPLCNNSAAISLMPYTMNNSGGWAGTGIVGSNFDPAVAGKGDFTLTYTTASVPSGLCPDISTVAVNVFSLATPVIAPAGPFCTTGKPVQLKADVQGGVFGGANNAAVNNQGLFIPASGVIGANIINYTISSGPCVAYAQTVVEVEEFVSAAFHTKPPSFCRTDQPVNLNQYVANPGGLWSGPGVSGNTMFSPALANPGSNNEIIYRTNSKPTASLCPDESRVRINVVVLPELELVVNSAKGCAPHQVFLNTPNTNQSGAQVEWVTGDGLIRKEGSSVSHLYTSPGTYSVLMNYTFEGCTRQFELDGNITVYPVPQADFRLPETLKISEPLLKPENTSTPLAENRYTWYVDGFPGNDEVHPSFNLPAIGKYKVKLVAENKYCKDEITKMIEVLNDFKVFVPNSFSPNYDGLNDEFKVVFAPEGLDRTSFSIQIYDRWGLLLFSSNDPERGWNGAAAKGGEVLKEGVYVYKMKYRDNEGNTFENNGHFSLLK